jgi:hypothetical protein
MFFGVGGRAATKSVHFYFLQACSSQLTSIISFSSGKQFTRTVAGLTGAPAREGGMATQIAQPNAKSAQSTGASLSGQVDPSTLSARERIRLHVQRNIQQQQQQQALQAQRQSTQIVDVQAPAQRKRPLESTKGGKASPTLEMTNTPPTRGDSPLGIDVPPKRRQCLGRAVYPGRAGRPDDCSSYGTAADDLRGDVNSDGSESEDLPSCSPPQGMLASRLDGSLGITMDINNSIYAVPSEDGETEVTGDSPAGGSPHETAGLGLCDSPPYEVRFRLPNFAWPCLYISRILPCTSWRFIRLAFFF